MQSADDVRLAYDAAAASYHRLLPDLSAEAPVDRALMVAFAEHVRAQGTRRVLDAGCGTGRLVAALQTLGLEPTGADLSPRMIQIARATNPDASFEVADLSHLPFPDGRFGGVIAWYSLIHTSPPDLSATLSELARTIAPGGYFLTGFQLGSGTRRIVDVYGAGHDLAAYLYTPERIGDAMVDVGLDAIATCVRAPVSERHPQGFVLARKRC
jgi:ubiquinone/menaquinone biosynthesis C-methylase UbiE